MNQLGHGANVEEMAILYKKNPLEVIDFSANINPYRVSGLERHLEEALNACSSYPDIHYSQLRDEIAMYLSCKAEQIIPGNGATEIIYLLMKSLQGTLGIVNPTFSEYERSARLSGLEVIDFYLHKDKGFSVDVEVIKKQLHKVDALFICNPNNPTGNVQALEDLLKLLAKEDKLLIVDETFMEFVEEEEKYSLVSYIKDYKNLIIIKAVTKFFGLPGLRLGYGITSNEALLEKMYTYKEPWTVNSFAEKLIEPMLKDKSYILKSKNYFKEERTRLMEALDKIEGIRAYLTDANFILLELEGITSSKLKEKLFIKHNILIRDAANFKGLDERFVRIAIKTQEENNKLVNALYETYATYTTYETSEINKISKINEISKISEVK